MIGRGLIVALLVAGCDQLVKTGVVALFAGGPPGRVIALTPFFNLLLTRNSGITFGLFNNDAAANSLLFSLAAIGVMGVLVWWLSRVETGFLAIAIGAIIGGAAGNVIDRLLDGSVVDFLDFHVGTWHWPAFNIADSAICLGVMAMLLEGFLMRRTAPEANGPGDIAP